MPNAEPAGGAPRRWVERLPRPLGAPASLSVGACTPPGSPLMPSVQSGELSEAMKPGDRLTNGSSWNSQTLAVVFRVLTNGRLEELSCVKFVLSKLIICACAEAALPGGAS